MYRYCVCGFLALAAASTAAFAQTGYPSRPVRIVVPFSTGTAADIVARQLASRLAEAWGQGVVVDNQGGAGGVIGAQTVAKATPDGHTLLMMGINNVINPSLYKDIGYDTLRDLRPIVRVAVAPLAIVAHPSFPASTIPELINLAKAKPKSIIYGSGGNGSVTHLAVELLKSKAAVDIVHVPYKGIAQMMSDILGNQIPLGCPAAASALPQVRAGKLKALAITTAKRTSAAPEIPTVQEAGIPDFDVAAWNGLLAPAKTADDIVNRVHNDTVKIAQSKAFVDQLAPQVLEVDLMNPATFRNYIAAELAKWSKLVKESGAKLD